MKRDALFPEDRLQELLAIFDQVVAKSEQALKVPAVNKLYEPTFVWNCAWEQLDLVDVPGSGVSLSSRQGA